MNLAHIINAYINVNLLVIAGFLCMGLYQLLVYLKWKPVGAGALLKLHYAVIVILFCSIFSYPLLPERKTDFPSVRIWSDRTEATFTEVHAPDSNAGIKQGAVGSNFFTIQSEDI